MNTEDLELAQACAAGDEAAWERFVRDYRPALYRAAEAIDPAAGRELADSLYAELFGLREKDGKRQSLFSYYQGRSSLATWLRAVLAQRHVDRIRSSRRLDPLPDEPDQDPRLRSDAGDPDQPRLGAMVRVALTAAVGALEPRDRLRLSFYYAQGMTLAAIGRALHEHEATVSRQLTRTRRAIRQHVERELRTAHGLDERTIEECFEAVLDDPGSLDLDRLIKVRALDRSME